MFATQFSAESICLTTICCDTSQDKIKTSCWRNQKVLKIWAEHKLLLKSNIFPEMRREYQTSGGKFSVLHINLDSVWNQQPFLLFCNDRTASEALYSAELPLGMKSCKLVNSLKVLSFSIVCQVCSETNNSKKMSCFLTDTKTVSYLSLLKCVKGQREKHRSNCLRQTLFSRDVKNLQN